MYVHVYIVISVGIFFRHLGFFFSLLCAVNDIGCSYLSVYTADIQWNGHYIEVVSCTKSIKIGKLIKREPSSSAMDPNAKQVPPGPAKGQQSLYPNPQPPTYEETMSPGVRAMPFQPVPGVDVPVANATPIMTVPTPAPIVQRKCIIFSNCWCFCIEI